MGADGIYFRMMLLWCKCTRGVGGSRLFGVQHNRRLEPQYTIQYKCKEKVFSGRLRCCSFTSFIAYRYFKHTFGKNDFFFTIIRGACALQLAHARWLWRQLFYIGFTYIYNMFCKQRWCKLKTI